MRDRRKVHFSNGTRAACRRRTETRRVTAKGHDVTCFACRSLGRWYTAREMSAWGLRERIRVALTRSGPLCGPTSRDVERVLGILSPGPLPVRPPGGQVVALDRYLEQVADPATYGKPDLVTLLDVLAPVHPGWDDVERAGEAWEPPTL